LPFAIFQSRFPWAVVSLAVHEELLPLAIYAELFVLKLLESFCNDNGRSSLPAKHNKRRLKSARCNEKGKHTEESALIN
jgi:hypothetical protein